MNIFSTPLFDVNRFLVVYGNIAPEPLLGLLAAGQAQDYKTARQIHDRLLSLTRAVCHRGSYVEGTVALKYSLVAHAILEHATVCSWLLLLVDGADKESYDAMASTGLPKVPQAY